MDVERQSGNQPAGGTAAAPAQAVPCDRRSDGTLQFVWQLPYGRIVIDVGPDGAVAVNGCPVPTVSERQPRTGGSDTMADAA